MEYSHSDAISSRTRMCRVAISDESTINVFSPFEPIDDMPAQRYDLFGSP